MTARRNRRAGVEDLWRKSDGSPSKLNGSGFRWRARYVDDENREHTKRFRTNADFHAASSTLVSGELVGESSVSPPGDGDGGEVGLA